MCLAASDRLEDGFLDLGALTADLLAKVIFIPFFSSSGFFVLCAHANFDPDLLQVLEACLRRSLPTWSI